MRLGRLSLVALSAVAMVAAGCADDGAEAPRPDARVVVSFEGYVYVDAAAATPTVLDRVQHEQQSLVSSLRRRRVSVDTRRQGVDVRTLVREPVRVVDPTPGAPPERVRVRYRFRALGRAPLAESRADIQLGLLQNDGSSPRAGIAEACVPSNERDAENLAAPWRAFDGALPSCVAAVSSEQWRIGAARAALGSANEVTSLEAERLYLPVVVRIRPRRPHPGTPRPPPRRRGATSAEPEPEPAPTASAKAEPAADVDPLAEPAGIDDGFDDLPDDQGGPADEPGAEARTGTPDHAGSKWLEPNYYILAFVAVALVVLLRRRPR